MSSSDITRMMEQLMSLEMTRLLMEERRKHWCDFFIVNRPIISKRWDWIVPDFLKTKIREKRKNRIPGRRVVKMIRLVHPLPINAMALDIMEIQPLKPPSGIYWYDQKVRFKKS